MRALDRVGLYPTRQILAEIRRLANAVRGAPALIWRRWCIDHLHLCPRWGIGP